MWLNLSAVCGCLVSFDSPGVSRCVISMRTAGLKRAVLALGGLGIVVYIGALLSVGYQQTPVTDKELDVPRVMKSFYDLEASIKDLRELTQ